MSLADSDATSFDPPVPVDNMAIWTMLLFYDQLVRVNADGTAVEPGLAESWSGNEEATQFTFNLRDATFHDGSPVTASDVAFSIMRARDMEGGAWNFILSAIESIDAPDDKTAVINLSKPWAPLEADLAMFSASIIPQALVEEQGEDFFQHPIGSGAFKFVSWEKDQEIVLEKNPDYWDTGKPYLDGVTFKVLPDSNARMLQFQGGELDIATSVPFNQLDSLQSNPDVTVVLDAVARFDYISLNTLRAPLDDVKVRQAINYAVDKQSIIDNVLFGYGEIANTFLPKMPGHDDSLPPYAYDVEKAKELLVGTAAENGFDLELITQAGDAVDTQVCQLIAAALAEIGGNITISQVDGATLLDSVFSPEPNFDMAKVYYTTDILDPDELATFGVVSDGGALAIGTSYKNEAVDQMILESQSDLDPESRQATYNEVQKIVQQDAHFLYLYYPSGRTAVQAAIQNFHILPTGNYRLYEVWRTDV
jgi:peptide/nickel transport system substrate-binding protein